MTQRSEFLLLLLRPDTKQSCAKSSCESGVGGGRVQEIIKKIIIKKSTDLHDKSVHNCSLHFILCIPVAAGRGKGSMFVDVLR